MKFLLTLLLLPFLFSSAHASTYARKGVNGNDPPTLNQFHADFVIEAFGLYLLNYDFGNSELFILLDELDSPLTVANVQALAQHPDFQHKYIVLREPDLNGTVGQEAAIADSEMELVRSGDPQAEFIIEIGTALHPPYQATSYGKKLLSRIAHPDWLIGIGLTFYPYVTAPSYHNFVHKTRAWLDTDYPALQQYIVETGIVTGVTPLTNYSMALVKSESADGVVAGWAWYAELAYGTAAAYDCLEDIHYQITATGQDFIAQ